MEVRKKTTPTDFNREADIAIGPIFFVMAIAAILASAMAVGSGALSVNHAVPVAVPLQLEGRSPS